MMKIVNIVLTLLFLLFAIFQFNDPDPLVWVLFYTYVAVMSALAIFKKYSLPLLIPGIVIFSLYFIYLLPGVSEWLQSDDELMNRMAEDKPYIEETREAGGLLIGLLVLGFHWITRNRYMKAFKNR